MQNRNESNGDTGFAGYLTANATSLGIALEDFRHIDAQLLPKLIEKCNHEFPDPPSVLWWPHSPRCRDEATTRPLTSRQFMDQLGYQRLPQLVQDHQERIWLIAENFGKPHRIGFDAMVGFDTTLIHAHNVIAESHGFEYVLVSQRFHWLIAENDHGYLMAGGDTVVRRLKEIATD